MTRPVQAESAPAVPTPCRQAEVARIRGLVAQRTTVFYPDIQLLLALYDEERAYQAWFAEPEDAARRQHAVQAALHATVCARRSQEWRVPSGG